MVMIERPRRDPTFGVSVLLRIRPASTLNCVFAAHENYAGIPDFSASKCSFEDYQIKRRRTWSVSLCMREFLIIEGAG